MFSIPDFPVTDVAEILLVPLLAVFFGMLAFLMGEFNEHLRGGLVWKWVGGIILAFGALTGYRFFLAMVSGSFEGKMYQAQIFQRRVIWSHWAAFWLPLVCLAIAILIVLWRKRARREAMDEF